jgi:preprotein translocase SecE subunit
VARNRQRARSRNPQPRSGGPLPAAGGGAGQPPIEDDPVAFADGDADDPREDDSMTAAVAAFGGSAGASPMRPETRNRNLFVRTIGFLEGSWAELRRVQWPDRPQVMQGTSVVLGFVVLTGVFLGVCDFVAGKLVNWIV